VTVDFRAMSGTTEIVITRESLPSEETAKGHAGGWTAILEILGKVSSDW